MTSPAVHPPGEQSRRGFQTMRRAGESGRVIAGVFLLSLLSLGMPALMAAGPGVATYEYDNLGRIKSVTYEDGSGQSYTYDKAGNRQTSGPLTSGGILQFGQASYSVVEGQPSATLSVTRTGSTASAITVHYKTTDGTAAAGSDYTAADSTLSWAAGDSAAKTISIPIADDSAIESIETFTVTLSGPTGGAALGAVTQATVSITDNDSVNFSVSDTSVVEGNTPSGTSATFTITRAGGSGTAYTVQYATAGITATSGTDFTATSGTASFAATEMTKQITVPIIGDAVYEGTETFKLVLSAPSGGATLSKPEGIATIQEDDTPPVFAVANASIVEGNSGTTVLTFTVTKSGATALSH